MTPLLLTLLACAACAPPPAPPTPVDAPADLQGPVLHGICDASAGVAVGDFLVVADDEHNALRVYRVPGFAPAGTIDLAALSDLFDGKEADLEGMAAAPDGRVWVVGSHDPGKSKKPKDDRQRLFALRLTPSGEGVTAALDGPVDTSGPMLPPVTPGTEDRTAKDPLGRSIEGLAWQDGHLVFGFRAPVRDGRAPLVDLVDGVATARWIDTGGRGFRALDTDGDALLAILGGDRPVLARIVGDRVETVGPTPADLTPEGLVRLADGWWVLSDDGRRQLDGVECRELPEDRRKARLAPILR
jgi:hypothetical protein